MESLAVVFALQYWKYIIHGCDVTIVTDHQALKHLLDRKEIKSNRMLRWRVEIANFETLGGSLTFEYNKGALHHVPDCLSRAPNPEEPELTEAEEELWVTSKCQTSSLEVLALTEAEEELRLASKCLVQNSDESGEVKWDAEAGSRPPDSFHMPDTESIVTQILKWQNEDDYAQAGIKYCPDGEHPENSHKIRQQMCTCYS